MWQEDEEITDKQIRKEGWKDAGNTATGTKTVGSVSTVAAATGNNNDPETADGTPNKGDRTGESGIGAHNDYIFSIVRSGIFGFCAYLALLLSAGVSIFMGFRKGITPFRVIALMIFVMWGVETIGLVPSAYPSFQWFAWGLIGMSLRFDKENLNIERVWNSLFWAYCALIVSKMV